MPLDYIGLSSLLKLIIVDVFFGVLIIIMVCRHCFKALSHDIWIPAFLELHFLKEWIKSYSNALKTDICKSEMSIIKYWKSNKTNTLNYQIKFLTLNFFIITLNSASIIILILRKIFEKARSRHYFH